ncbi:MAG: hypothetical protein MJ181_01840 [Treponema sp.]|nr:hypothetical protein [Treponema sp.]
MEENYFDELDTYSEPEFNNEEKIIEEPYKLNENNRLLNSLSESNKTNVESIISRREYYVSQNKHDLLENFIKSDNFPFEINRCGVDIWFEDFEFGFYSENTDTEDIILTLEGYGFKILTFSKRFIREKDKERMCYIVRIDGSYSAFFEDDFWLWDAVNKKEYIKNPSEENIAGNEIEDNEEDCTLDTLPDEIDNPESENKKKPYKLRLGRIFFLCVFLLFGIMLIFLSISGKPKKNNKFQIEHELEVNDLVQENKISHNTNIELEKPAVAVWKGNELYTLMFESTDGTTRVFEKATYEKTFFNYVVNMYEDSYSINPKAFCIFPRKEIKSISGTIIE